MKINLSEVRQKTGVGFGTSGIRDRNDLLTDKTVYLYTLAFLKHAKELGEFENKKMVAIAGDLRVSTERIMMAVAKSIDDSQLEVINCGYIPTPAVAHFGFQNTIPSIMVTGSHIPGDRNGVKFQLSSREILKDSENIISNATVEMDDRLFDESGEFISKDFNLVSVDERAKNLYVKRYLDFFGNNLLANKRIGVYGHSTVCRDIMVDLFEQLGAMVVKIEFSEKEFVAVDTDSVDEVLISKMHQWDSEYNLDHIISTDGDGDRPLLSDENGLLVRPELLPILASKFLGVEVISTTLTACTTVEKSNFFKKVIRTKVSLPYVIDGMIELEKEGYGVVAGYELNGGFLLQTDVVRGNKKLARLPTRDSLFPILATIALTSESKTTVSKLVDSLPNRHTYASSIKGIETQKSLDIISNWEVNKSKIEAIFGVIKDINQLDGLRLTFENGDIVHFRPSKNSPEFRNYTESDGFEKARDLSEKALELIKEWTS